MNLIRIAMVLSLLLAQACTSFPPVQPASTGEPLPATPTPLPNSTPAPTTAPTEPTNDGEGSPQVLRVWLPPQFDPAQNSSGSKLLKERLAEFTQRRPGIKLDIRIKATTGTGGMIDMLSAASSAAPGTLPDLIALPRPELEAAALKGLIHPMDGLSASLDDPDWYDYARQLARLQKSTYGIPFAGDALLLIYRPSIVKDPPRDLETALKSKGPFVFPASDEQALFTLNLYLASGGSIQDDQGRPSLDAETLSKVLDYYQKADQAGLIPFWLPQESTDDQAWAAFNDKKANMVVTWSSRYLSQDNKLPADTAAAPLPTLNGTPYTLAGGWVWALGSAKPERQELALELAQFLTESSFLARWTAAAGYLPARSSVLSAWTKGAMQSLASQVVLSAHLYPSADMLSGLAPVLRQATIQVLNHQGEPLQLAQEAANRLKNP